MKKSATWRAVFVVVALAFGLAEAASAHFGIGVATGGWLTPDCEPLKGFFDYGTLRLEADFFPYAGLEARVSCFSGRGRESAGHGWKGCDFDLDILALEAGPFLKLPLDPIALYGGGGVGAYLSDGSLEVREGGLKHSLDFGFGSDIGAYAFGGVQFFVTDNASIFAEARYTWLDVEMDTEWWNGGKFIDGESVSFSGFGSFLGVMIWF